MSILDFTTGLFREPASLQSFVDNPEQALRDAGLPDVTPEQVHDLLPLVAESMPADHPLQTVVHAPDPLAALLDLDVAQLTAALREHGRADAPDKSVSDVIAVDEIECTPIDTDDISEPAKALDEADDPLPEVDEDLVAPVDDYRRPDDLIEPDFSSASWGKEIE